MKYEKDGKIVLVEVGNDGLTKPSVKGKCTVGTDVLLCAQSETFFGMIVMDVIVRYEVVVHIKITNRITNVGKGRRITSIN